MSEHLRCIPKDRAMKINLPFLSIFVFAALAVSGTAVRAFDCDAAETTTEQIECLNLAYETADGELNAGYEAIMEVVEGTETGELLYSAQIEWVEFRDAACEAEMSYYSDGSIAPLIYSECLTRLTWSRVEDFTIIYEQVSEVE